MIRLSPGDLAAVERDRTHYHVLVLDTVKLFGAPWLYVFHATSPHPLAAEVLTRGPQAGFHAFVDLLPARREGRLQRIARGVDVRPYCGPGYLKRTFATMGKASEWTISDMTFTEVRRTPQLTAAERDYPLEQAIDETLMIARVRRQWRPSDDPRIR